MRTVLVALAATLTVAGCTSSATTGRGSAAAPSSPAAPASSSASTSGATPAGSTTPPSTTPSATPPAGAGLPAGGPVPPGFTPVSATFVSATQGWVLGTAPCTGVVCTSVLRTRDGGHSWQGIPAPSATLGQPDSGRNGDVSVVRFATARDGWAGVGRLYSTHDGGSTWQLRQLGPASSVVSNIETGGGYVFATVDGCPSQGGNSCAASVQVYASRTGLDQWRAVSPAFGGGSGAAGLVVHGATWYLPTPTGISIGTGFTAPRRVSSPCAADGRPVRPRPVLAVADASHLDALCVGPGAAGSARWQLYGTVDGARTWVRAGGPYLGYSSVTGIADSTRGVLLVAAASGASAVFRTTDDGVSFQRASVIAPGGGVPWADLGFTTPTQAVVVSLDHGLYLSQDAGATFQPVAF